MKILLKVRELRPGMIVTKSVYGANSQLLINEGVSLTESHINYFKRQGIGEIEVTFGASRSSWETVENFQEKKRENKQLNSGSKQHINAQHAQLLSEEAQYETFIIEELKLEIQNLCRKLLKMVGLNQDFIRNTETHIHSLIEQPHVLESLLKLKVIGDGRLTQALQVAILATVMGRKMGIIAEDLQKLTIAALLYDIGNFWVERSILLKPTMLNEGERRIVEEHTIIGYLKLKEMFGEQIARVAYQHHERHNGTGYPQGLAKDNIDLFTKIVSIADVYIALISLRPFRQKYEPREAVEYILGAGGTLFDPVVVSTFLEVVSVYAVGDIVELTNGSIGVIVKTAESPIGRPLVEILYDERGTRQHNKKLDLAEHLTVFIKKVLQ